MKRTLGLLLLLSCAAFAAGNLQIYFIDVEGGASTLVVTPEGESVLMDAGYAGNNGRDVGRIERALKDAGVSRIDYFLVSHFHGDHAGGVEELSKRFSVGKFIDHGDAVDKDSPNGNAVWEAYRKAAAGKRQIAKPGDKLPVKGVEILIVASHSDFIDEPLPGGGPNPHCDTFRKQAEDKGENGKSLGYWLKFGDFEFVNLSDLSWNFQGEIACPMNLLGKIDLFQATHHGVRDDVLPQQMWAMEPAVTVMNNGPTKGAGKEAVATVLKSPKLTGFWQLHRAVNNDAAHNAKTEYTANLGETEGCEGHWIKATVNEDGTYTLTNSRNGFSKSYKAR